MNIAPYIDSKTPSTHLTPSKDSTEIMLSEIGEKLFCSNRSL